VATALAIAILGAALTALLGFSWPLAVNLLIVLLGVAGFTAAVSSRGQRTALFALVAVGCSAAVAFALSWAMRTAGERRWALVGLSLAALLVGGLTTGSALPAPLGLVLWPGLGLGVLYGLLRLSAPGAVPNGLHWWASFYVVALIALAPWIGTGALGEGGTQVAMAVVILLFFVVFAVIQVDYHRAAGFDQSAPAPAPTPTEPSRVPRSWVSLAPFAAAAVGAYFFFILPAARAANFKTETATTPWAPRPWLWALLAVALAGVTLLLSGRRGAPRTDHVFVSGPTAAAAVSAGVVWVGGLLVSYRQAPDLRPAFLVLSLLAALLLAVLTMESILTNPSFLQDLSPSPGVFAIAGASGLAVFASVLWLTTCGIWAGAKAATVPSALVAGVVSYVGGYGVALLCAIAVARGSRVPSLTEDPASFNAFQDQFLYFCLASLAVWAGAVTFAQAPGGAGGSLWSAGLQSVSLLPPLAFLFAFTLRNNLLHLDRQRTRIEKLSRRTGYPRDPERWLRALRRHIWFQNLSATAIAIISLIGVASVISAEFQALVQSWAAAGRRPRL
jgi:hypothetical protein